MTRADYSSARENVMRDTRSGAALWCVGRGVPQHPSLSATPMSLDRNRDHAVRVTRGCV